MSAMHDLVASEGADIEDKVKEGDFSKCPVEGQKEIQLFQIRALRVLLANSNGGGRSNNTSVVLPASISGFVAGIILLIESILRAKGLI